MWWTAVAGTTRTVRRDREDPTILENFEWLAGRSSAFGVKAGAPRRYEQAELTRIYEDLASAGSVSVVAATPASLSHAADDKRASSR